MARLTRKLERFDVEVLFQIRTLRAVCVRADEDADDVWLPLSSITLDPPEPLMRGQRITVRAPEALLIEKGLV
ncbi:hypothetical protein [Albimonas pacifica]|uniref:Uncharacterized protein n=1 Tax=Albimonas pacifica TaxID=1114924 RepID=A0A1I3HJV3_9RHOB|nr:hypothetical protein [Albimonas pacifica]SFI35962.1 hypothetical protein SAMN05216258_10635 [Albimonas pacifica]